MNGKGERWAKEDLARRLCDALDVAANAIRWLTPAGYSDAAEPTNNVRPEKVISESALLLLAASTVQEHPEVRERVVAVAGRLALHARSDRMLLGMCLEPALAWEYAQAHVCLGRIGYPDARFDAALDGVAKSQASRGRERPPHRALEQMWVAQRCERHAASPVRAGRTAAPRLVRDTNLCLSMDLLNGSREDLYAFTHALMYVTDFNIRPWRLPRPRARILAEAEAALARCLDEEDYDLAGELLLSWPLTGRSWGTTATFAFRVLAHVEDQAGFLPSIATRLDRLATLSGEARTTYLLATGYHTAYVMGLLCAAALQSGRAPPVSIGHRTGTTGSSRRLLPLLHGGRGTPYWCKELETLSEGERDSLSGMLLSIGLRRSVVQRDFSRLQELLRVGHASGLGSLPAASQAAELLGRLVCISGNSATIRPS